MAPVARPSLQAAWGSGFMTVLPASSYVWTIRETDTGVTIQDGGRSAFWGLANYQSLPQVTLSAETSQAESTIAVPKQRSYTGRKSVIRSALANTPCINAGVHGVLERLNATLGTSYTLNATVLRSVLESFVAQNYDFGTVYTNIRPYWYDLTTIRYISETWDRHREMRQHIPANNMISGENIPPRRIWDLYANRVVPFWVAFEYPRPISHAWVSDEERMNVWTPINGFEWSVPIPEDANLDLIRIEMLNLRAEYVWLDVLCLRQENGWKEDLRKEEWKVDVPTIGSIYRNAMVVYYLSGLGRPFCLQPGDLESKRCWFRRAWMLQEVSNNSIIGGETGNHWTMETSVRLIFKEELQALQTMTERSVFNVLWQMRNRISTKPLDKVAGLAYVLSAKSIPIYESDDSTQSEEDAWAAFVDVMPKLYLQEFLLYPEPGNGCKLWRPSWSQVMAGTLPSFGGITRTYEVQMGELEGDWYEGHRIKSSNVRGLADVSNEGILRQGESMVKDFAGAPHTFKIHILGHLLRMK
ncbi:hypothetical protein EV421DRAFT_2030075 [Armillaria borealis]|uniref:Heterokaryon incompatibility domain-containing protein n=1 Tax=Armillaria borealis TaxID=47425 RepID=A0AA39K1T5_9AGAR|nr:hypothetical protein EV421DRAFT_2030075 [Armillaria borealis]